MLIIEKKYFRSSISVVIFEAMITSKAYRYFYFYFYFTGRPGMLC
jgi:hypothetical protein